MDVQKNPLRTRPAPGDCPELPPTPVGHGERYVRDAKHRPGVPGPERLAPRQCPELPPTSLPLRTPWANQRVRPKNTASAYGADQAGASHAAPRRARQSGSKRHLPSSESRRPYRFAAFLGSEARRRL